MNKYDEDFIDIRVLMCEILKPDMIKAGIIPEGHKWEDTTDEQGEKVVEFIENEINKFIEVANDRNSGSSS